MKITNIMLNLDRERRILAFVNLTFDDCFVVRGIRITQKQDGKRIMAMPSRQNKAGEYQDVCFPITSEFRQRIEHVIMNRVDDMLNQGSADGVAKKP